MWSSLREERRLGLNNSMCLYTVHRKYFPCIKILVFVQTLFKISKKNHCGLTSTDVVMLI